MLSKLQYKKLDDKGLVPFTVKDDVILNIITENEGIADHTMFFSKNGMFYGELVAVKVYPIKNGLIERDYISGVGLMVQNQSGDGCYVVPANKCNPIDETKEAINPIETVNKEFDKPKQSSDIEVLVNEPKKVLGFTYKQLLIIGLIAIIIRKI